MYRTLIILAVIITLFFIVTPDMENRSLHASDQPIILPKPDTVGKRTFEQCLTKRRSVREFSGDPLNLEQISQLLWATAGQSSSNGRLTIPSAGALYPLHIYLAVRNVTGLPKGIYEFLSSSHSLNLKIERDMHAELAEAALSQIFIKEAPAIIVITAEYRRSTAKYGERGETYSKIEVGHAAQNLYLQSAALELGTVYVGAFKDKQLSQVLGLSSAEYPLALLPVGKPTR